MDDQDKKLKDFVDRIMKEAPLESPSVDFTQSVWERIAVQSKGHTAVSKPLLPKGILIGAALIFVGGLLYLLALYGIDTDKSWFKPLAFDAYVNKSLGWMKGYTASKSTLYAVLLFGFLFLVQLPWLKRYLDQYGTL